MSTCLAIKNGCTDIYLWEVEAIDRSRSKTKVSWSLTAGKFNFLINLKNIGKSIFRASLVLGGTAAGTCASGFGVCCTCK